MKKPLFRLSKYKTFSMLGLLLSILFIMEACSSGKRALERGDYYESVMISVNRLQRNSDHKKSRQSLAVSYPLAVQFHETNIRNLSARQDRERWRGILDSYTKINNMYEGIRRSPGALQVVPNPKNYYDKLAEAQQNAAEESYQLGLQELDKNTREAGKVAYALFQDTDSYVPGYRDVNQRLEQAYWAATLKVLIAPIPVTSARTQLSANFFEDKIHEYLKNEPVGQFVRFMTEGELQSFNLLPDHVLQLSFDEFVIGETHTVERQIDQRKDSVKVGSVDASNLVNSNAAATTTSYTNNYTNTQNNNNNSSSGSTNTSSSSGNTSSGTSTSGTSSSGSVSTGSSSGGTGTASTGGSTSSGSSSGGTTTGTSTNSGSSNAGTTTTGSNTTTSGSSTGTTGSTTGTTSTSSGGSSSGTTTTSSSGGSSSGSTGTTSGSTSSSNVKTVSICHKTANGTINMNVAVSALSAHLNHGDNLYTCGTNSTRKVRVCHKTGAGKMVNLEVAQSAVAAHLKHGDQIGGCDGSGYEVSEAPAKNKESKPGDSKGKKGNGDESAKIFELSPAGQLYAGGNISPLNYLAPIMIDTSIDVYQQVRAKVFIFEKTLRSYGTLDFKIIEPQTNSLVSAEKLNGEYVWMSRWGYFNGDERALTAEQREIISQREAAPPNDQQLFIGFTRPIFDQLVIKLRTFYARNY